MKTAIAAGFDDEADSCPRCQSDWRGKLIPPKDRHFFAGTKPHFRRLVGVEVPGYDGVSYWQCPDCNAMWDRWTGTPTNIPIQTK